MINERQFPLDAYFEATSKARISNLDQLYIARTWQVFMAENLSKLQPEQYMSQSRFSHVIAT